MSFSLECESVIHWVRASDAVSSQSEVFGSQNLFCRYFPSKKSQLRQKKSPNKLKQHGTFRNSTEQFLLEKLEVAYLLKKYTQTYDTAIFTPFFHKSLHIPTPHTLHSNFIRLIFHIVPSPDLVTSEFCLKYVCPLYVSTLPIVRKVNEFSSGWWQTIVDLRFNFNLITLNYGMNLKVCTIVAKINISTRFAFNKHPLNLKWHDVLLISRKIFSLMTLYLTNPKHGNYVS